MGYEFSKEIKCKIWVVPLAQCILSTSIHEQKRRQKPTSKQCSRFSFNLNEQHWLVPTVRRNPLPTSYGVGRTDLGAAQVKETPFNDATGGPSPVLFPVLLANKWNEPTPEDHTYGSALERHRTAERLLVSGTVRFAEETRGGLLAWYQDVSTRMVWIAITSLGPSLRMPRTSVRVADAGALHRWSTLATEGHAQGAAAFEERPLLWRRDGLGECQSSGCRADQEESEGEHFGGCCGMRILWRYFPVVISLFFNSEARACCWLLHSWSFLVVRCGHGYGFSWALL
jgi:hypothetical protein